MEKELYNSLVLDTYIRLIKVKYPEILVEDLMEYAGIEKYEIGDPTVWFTQTQVNRFHEKLGTITDNLKVAREAGRFAAEPNSLGELRGMIVSLGGICNAFRFMGRYARRLNRSSSYITRKISRNQMEVTVTPFEGVTEQKFQCENRQGNFKGIADLFAHKEITISHPECLFEGGKQCRYIISWKESALSHVSRVKKILGVLSLIMAILWFPILGSLVPTATVIGVLILFLVLGWLTEKAKLSKIIASLNQVYDTKEELLKQIDINSENAQVIIDIGQALRLGRPDASTIDRVAQITGQRLKYDRVMIMIANEERTQLLYHGGSGFSRQEQSYLRHYRISLEQPSEGVFVEAFIRAEPILVNDMEKLREKSTPRSFRPAEFMKPLAFIVCPVTYDETVVGIIVAGNIETPKKMGRNDKNLMMGVAQQIGSAFHKQKIEAEYEAINRHLVQVQKTEALGVLASGIAHDFNNILSPIMGYTDLCLTHPQVRGETADYLHRIKKASGRAQDLVRQILAFSRQGKQEFVEISISAIVKETLLLLRASMPANIEIKKNIYPNLKPILADPTTIHQVVMNLCTNAYQAMGDRGGVLTVTLTQEEILSGPLTDTLDLPPGPYLKLSISDTGSGMPKEIRDRIFEPYFTTKELNKGTGLGLSITHNIIRQLKGHIEVTSVPGQGTCFDVYLPQMKESAAPQKTETVKTIPGGTETLLVVDDNAPVLEMVEEVLSEKGYRVAAFLDPSRALDFFRSHPQAIDLVITDMTMPGITGLTLAKKMMEVKPGIPVLLCTGYSEGVYESSVLELGIKALFIKPLDINRLSAAIREELDRYFKNQSR